MKGLATDGNNINCYTCQSWKDCNVASAHGYKVGACTQYAANKPRRTNADRIRRMTDEEIAEFLEPYDSGCPPTTRSGCPYPNTKEPKRSCKYCWLEWLQREVSE